MRRTLLIALVVIAAVPVAAVEAFATTRERGQPMPWRPRSKRGLAPRTSSTLTLTAMATAASAAHR
jgi:hypothetical protein